ncbi:Etr1p [Sugiyamaella lignohabitans]|uniref:enoyl-[acyl-carrier-protein] reductase n=1 Tax=Sugiyamaella lignohabitans TaxID=796027 RepID=A0A167DX98_9ASCO|nr:Etr1p [Sugiyamaella lignohabitans]ANB13403.1 Etr1p [Sugiyamaella lignohabitans]
MFSLSPGARGPWRAISSFERIGRSLRYSSTVSRAIIYSEYGNPRECVKVFEHKLEAPTGSQAIIRLLAAPINPSDINQIEGVYPSRPELSTKIGTTQPSAVGGNEGVFEVVSVGNGVSSLKVGDWVLPGALNFGTWRTHISVDESQVYKLRSSEGLTPLQAATVSVNPTTAHQMLTEFVNLQKGDWFIQNGATSGVGRAAIQLGRIWGLNSISVIRDRAEPDLAKIKDDLYSLGATHVVTDSELNDKSIKKQIDEWTGGASIQLGFNCVGGKSATNVARQLGHSGQLITYGGMSKQPLTFPTSLFIFKNFISRGYWLSEWSKKNPQGKFAVVEKLLDLYRAGELTDVPVTKNTWRESSSNSEIEETFKTAIDNSKTGKQLIELV